MSATTFYFVFGATWIVAMAYGLSAFRLLWIVRRLKQNGKAGEAPDPLTNPFEVFGYLGWLLTGRYAELGDDAVTRWAGVARALFVVALPMILIVFVVAGAGAVEGLQPT